MTNQTQHARNCSANWRGWPVTLTEFVPDDAPCTCGAEARAAARTERKAQISARQAA